MFVRVYKIDGKIHTFMMVCCNDNFNEQDPECPLEKEENECLTCDFCEVRLPGKTFSNILEKMRIR